MMAGKSLAYFAAPPSKVLTPGKEDLATVEVTPVDEMPILKLVADDEGVQHKAFNYGWEKLHIRGYSESETSHPAWNAFRKAISATSLVIPMMKLSLICRLTGIGSSRAAVQVQNRMGFGASLIPRTLFPPPSWLPQSSLVFFVNAIRPKQPKVTLTMGPGSQVTNWRRSATLSNPTWNSNPLNTSNPSPSAWPTTVGKCTILNLMLQTVWQTG
ncbi:rplM [Symbiodinium microadriaticum]|nr:rplM [Symbiodinium microadriaticum]